MDNETDKPAYADDFEQPTAAILPGENPLEFQLLHTQVAEEWAPDGPIEEHLVLTVAKCIWRIRRNQGFLRARRTAATCDPESRAYDEESALTAFFHVLGQEMNEGEIAQSLHNLGGILETDLRKRCPRRDFKTVKAWIKALRIETMKMYMQATRFGSAPPEVLAARSAAVLTDEMLAAELNLEERNNALMSKAISQLRAIKAAKNQLTFREVQRFNRAHPVRLAGLVRRRV
ncbi:hypothetical protein [Bradyrhizobium sp. AUGA SZCCT0182]|uniref:hypothetical protein n=1 Tax=Bradyrhizobium sp. AUGA SZCCT0182 TaxID=2807667 RepID=UPI001BAA4E94|nr:hypothetical protein [Bradyrhizobium sp. AUGA SZCCT0182]MBR1232812.1 hypothetical protein [Bradyrhizobium sp. AUGA SZCCT0182]